MRFCHLTDDEYDKFVLHHPQNNLNQSIHIVRFQRNRGIDVELVGVKQGKKVIAACSLVYSKRPFNYKLCESIKGPIMDYRNVELVSFFTTNIKNYLKDRNVCEYVISPYIIHKQRDIHGRIVDGGEDNSDIISILSRLGYRHQGFDVNLNNVNWMVVKDVSQYKTDEDMLNSFYNRTRRAAVKNAENCGVYIEEVNETNIDIFYNIIKNASETKHFHGRSREFYSKLISSIDSRYVKLLLSCININNYRDKLLKLLGEEKKKNERLQYQYKSNPNKNNARKLEISEGLIRKYNKTISEIKNYPTDENGVLPLSAVYFFCYGPEVVAAIGGARDEFRRFDGATAIYWHMMKFARANGYKKFNFYGTFGIFDEKSPGHTIYLFKKGWGGEVVNTLGEFSLSIKPFCAYFYRMFKFIKNILSNN